MEIGIIGLGRMGAGRAERWVPAGHRVVGHNRSRGPIDELAAKGMEPAYSVATMASTLVGLNAAADAGQLRAILDEAAVHDLRGAHTVARGAPLGNPRRVPGAATFRPGARQPLRGCVDRATQPAHAVLGPAAPRSPRPRARPARAPDRLRRDARGPGRAVGERLMPAPQATNTVLPAAR